MNEVDETQTTFLATVSPNYRLQDFTTDTEPYAESPPNAQHQRMNQRYIARYSHDHLPVFCPEGLPYLV